MLILIHNFMSSYFALVISVLKVHVVSQCYILFLRPTMEETVLRFLDKIHIHVKINWLRAVIMFAKSHGVGNEEATLCKAVVEQLLYSNLSDSYEPLTKVPVVAMKAVIVKQMIFQVVSVINVARSCYDQYCECIDADNDLSWFHGDEDTDDLELQSHDTNCFGNSTRRRMLKIKLFDGQNTVHAIEYGGKLTLDENTLPGTKILLIARVLLRKGILLLNSSNCQILHGDIDGKPLHLKSLFAERLGIKQDIKEHRSSTISPFLIRIPRIPKQLLHNPEMETQCEKSIVKSEVHCSERTAVVPPLQNNLVPSALVPPLHDAAAAGVVAPLHNNSIPEYKFASSRMQKELLLPPDGDTSCSKASFAPTEDLPIPLGNSQIFPHVLSKPDSKIYKPSLRNNVDSLNKSIMEYFPVSRNKREVEKTSKGDVFSAHPIHPVPTVPLSEQRLVVVVDKNDQVVGTEFCERQQIRAEDVPPSHKIAMSTTEGISSFASSRDNSNVSVKGCFHLNNSVLGDIEEAVMMTTQELINSSSPESRSIQNDSDLISFIASSVSKEITTEENRSPPRTRFINDPPSTAVVPYKRGRISDRMQQISFPMGPRHHSSQISVMDRFNELNVVCLNDAFSRRKFWMLPKVVRVMGICHIKGQLIAKHGSWLLDVCITDESMNSQRCIVDGQLLESLLGFSVRHCEKLNREKNMHELSRCKQRAIEVMKSFERLDLVFSLEIHPQKYKLPLVVNVCCLSEAINIV